MYLSFKYRGLVPDSKIQNCVPKGELPVVLRLHIVVERSISGLAAKNLNRKNYISRWTKENEADERCTIYVSQLNRLASAGIFLETAWSGQISSFRPSGG